MSVFCSNRQRPHGPTARVISTRERRGRSAPRDVLAEVKTAGVGREEKKEGQKEGGAAREWMCIGRGRGRGVCGGGETQRERGIAIDTHRAKRESKSRSRERDREERRETHTDRERETHTHTEKERERERERDTHRQTERERQRDPHTEREIRHTPTHTQRERCALTFECVLFCFAGGQTQPHQKRVSTGLHKRVVEALGH